MWIRKILVRAKPSSSFRIHQHLEETKRRKPDGGRRAPAPFWRDETCLPLVAMLPEPTPSGELRPAAAVAIAVSKQKK